MNYLIRIRQISPLPHDVQAGRNEWQYKKHPMRAFSRETMLALWRDKWHRKAWRLSRVARLIRWKNRVRNMEYHRERLLRGIGGTDGKA